MTQLKNIMTAKPQTPAIAEEIADALKETENIIAKIKDANEEQGPVNKVATAIAQKAAGILSPSGSSVSSETKSNKNCDIP